MPFQGIPQFRANNSQNAHNSSVLTPRRIAVQAQPVSEKPLTQEKQENQAREKASHFGHNLANISINNSDGPVSTQIQQRSGNDEGNRKAIDGIEQKNTPANDIVIQRVKVADIKQQFENLAKNEGTEKQKKADEIKHMRENEKNYQEQLRKRQAEKQAVNKPDTSNPQTEVNSPPLESQSATLSTDSQVSDVKPIDSAITTPNLESQAETNDINEQVKENLNKISDYVFNSIKELKKENTEETNNDDYKTEYERIIQEARILLPELLSQRKQDKPDAERLLNEEEIQNIIEEILSKEQTEESDNSKKPKQTGKERWNKLKKIVRTDPDLPNKIIGKSKSLVYEDKIGGEEDNYWIEAWDALHRPGFKLLSNRRFGQWVNDSGIIEWVDAQEKRDKEMRAAYEAQKTGGEADFWEWKKHSPYANESSPPEVSSFWDWLEQTGEGDNIEKVKYLESEVERRAREVIINGGQWTDAFGDNLSSQGSHAIDAPGGGTDWMIFVLSPDGKFYAGTHQEGKYHHSSALAGIPIKCAGAIKVIDGKLIEICDKTGHYKSDKDQIFTTLNILKARGVNLSDLNVYTFPDYEKSLKGHLWREQYLKSEEYKKYQEKQVAHAFTLSGRDRREKENK